MITNNVFEMFGTSVSHATAGAVELQDSMDASVQKADDIDSNTVGVW